MLAAVERHPGAILARCLADHYAAGRPRRLHRPGRLPPLQVLDSAAARAAILIQDVEIGMPTQVLIRADAIRAGLFMEAPEGLVIGVDWWWFARLLCHGDLLLINAALVEEHQGDHPTITSTASTDFLYEEMRRLRRDLTPLVPPERRPRDARVPEGIVSLVQAASDLRARHPIAALRRAAAIHSVAAWAHTARLLLRRRFPGRFEHIPRLNLGAPAPGRADPLPAAPPDMLTAECPQALSVLRS